MLPDDNGPWVKYEDAEQAHRDATEEVAKAHKRGWEQAKREAAVLVNDMFHRRSFGGPADFSDAIAAMEYKEPTNDQQRTS